MPTRPGLLLIFLFLFFIFYWYKNFALDGAHTSCIYFYLHLLVQKFHLPPCPHVLDFVISFCLLFTSTFVKNAQSQVSKREMLKKRNVGGKKRDLVGVHKERDVVLLCLAHILKSQYPGTFTALVSTRVHQKPVP